jgi:hypothetical protein
MNEQQDVTFTLDRDDRKSQNAGAWSEKGDKVFNDPIPRIARLMALAIRLEGLIRDGTLRDYADVAQRGQVSRARMTQIMKLLDLAPDIQEQILFLPPNAVLNERRLRPVTAIADWGEQRRMFQEITCCTPDETGSVGGRNVFTVTSRRRRVPRRDGVVEVTLTGYETSDPVN